MSLVFFCFNCTYYFVSMFLVVSTSAIDCLERFVSEMTCYMSSGTLNRTRLLTLGFSGIHIKSLQLLLCNLPCLHLGNVNICCVQSAYNCIYCFSSHVVLSDVFVNINRTPEKGRDAIE